MRLRLPPLLQVSFCIVAFLAGAVLSRLLLPSPCASNNIIPIQVAPGEAWAAYFDVDGGQPVTVGEYLEPYLYLTDADGNTFSKVVAMHLSHPNHNKAGDIFTDGTALIYRLDDAEVIKSAILAKKMPVLPTKGRITATPIP